MIRKPVDPLRNVKQYERDNAACAAIIAADPARYPGLMAEWAALLIERQQPTIRGPLFRERAA
jgi:hypothetical protein